MDVTAWAAAIVGVLTSLALVVNHVLDQVPKLSVKIIEAVRSVRQVKREISRRDTEEESDAE
ncbi:hypothetical protein ACFWFU_33050 [Streptomyces sp. NPDC060235]|uniref:hypothetical protein n=1 Tax=Streptomyces sp. NPDC060235 TaxID=3347080 RepID=UPI0036579A6E